MRRDRRATGRYEVRDYQDRRLKVIVWCEPGKPELVMTTIAAERLPLLAEARTPTCAACRTTMTTGGREERRPPEHRLA